MFSLLWSEHCAYKHSKKLLGRLPTEGPRVVMGPGENAGAVDIGGGHSVAFKVESHNHPSAVEPFQGAATGIGGIMRDVFAIGARPIAVLDSLRFGEPSSERSRYLFEGAVAGIGHYGNSIGVPNVGGEVYFEPPYEQNCLVNAMCVGLARTERMIRAAAAGPGNVIVLIGAATGRDGIGGASVLASAELEAGDDSKRPTVQIGDPFEESKLLEVCLELLDRELLVSLQDLGAAGLTSSAGEMASAGGVGIDIDVARVPKREPDIEPFEVMVSESQERMLAVVEPSRVDEVIALCERWQTNANAIGEVTDSGHLRVLDDGVEVGDVPVTALVDECPLYDLEPAEPVAWIYGNEATLGERVALAAGSSADPEDPSSILLGAARLAQHRLEALGLRAVRRRRRLAHGAAPRGRGRRGADDPRVRPRDRHLDRRERPARRVRPARRHDRGGARVRPEPRLRRRRAAGVDQLPELRQPREAGRRVAARPLRNGAGRRLQRARGPGGRRQRLALQRDGAGPDLPHARRRHGRRAPRPRARARLGAERRRRDRARRPLRPFAGGLRAGQAAGRARRRAARDRDRARSPRPSLSCASSSARASPARPTTSATAASQPPWPRWRSPATSAPRSTSIPSSSFAAALARRRCSARARAACCSRARWPARSRKPRRGGRRRRGPARDSGWRPARDLRRRARGVGARRRRGRRVALARRGHARLEP